MNHSKLSTTQANLVLTLFQAQNGERLLSDFTDVDESNHDLKIENLKITNAHMFDQRRTIQLIYDFTYNTFYIYSRINWAFNKFPIFDHISFEDKV